MTGQQILPLKWDSLSLILFYCILVGFSKMYLRSWLQTDLQKILKVNTGRGSSLHLKIVWPSSNSSVLFGSRPGRIVEQEKKLSDCFTLFSVLCMIDKWIRYLLKCVLRFRATNTILLLSITQHTNLYLQPWMLDYLNT